MDTTETDCNDNERFQNSKGSEILFENVARRNKFERHFKRRDGLYQAVISPQAINYYDEEKGEFLEIDNRFSEDNTDGDFKGFCNKSGAAKIKIAKSLAEDKLLTVRKGNYGLSFSLIGQRHGKKFFKKVESIAENKSAVSGIKKAFAGKSEMYFRDCFEGADLQYVLTGSYLKDNIIVKEKSDDYEYEFILKTENLNLQLSDDGRNLEFYIEKINDEGTTEKEVQFTVPAPYMTDANGERSEGVNYELEDGACFGEYVFTIKADEKWINSEKRKFPVVIDPMIIFGPSLLETDSKFVLSNGKDGILTQNCLKVGNFVDNNSCYSAKSLIHFSLPEDLKGKIIQQAYVQLLRCYLIEHEGNEDNFDVYEITGPITDSSGNNVEWFREMNSVTWNNLPPCKSSPYARIPYEKGDNPSVVSENKNIKIDLTKLVKKWVKDPSTNHGFILQSSDEDIENHLTSMELASLEKLSEVDRDNHDLIGLHIIYSDQAEIVSDKQQKNSAKRAGTGMIDLYTQNLIFTHEDVNFGGERLPINLLHIYNKKWAKWEGITLPDGEQFASYSYNIAMGLGWKTNFHQYIVKYNDKSKLSGHYIPKAMTPEYIYIDGLGNPIILSRSYLNGQGDYEICDEQGRGLTYDPDNYKLTDKAGNSLVFDENGRLRKILDLNGNMNSIQYDSLGRMASIKDSLDRFVKFEYALLSNLGSGSGSGTSSITDTSDVVLKKISWAYGAQYLNFSYNGPNLTKITYKDGNHSEYGYASDLFSARDMTGYCIKYQFWPLNHVLIKESTNVSKIAHGSVTNCTEINGNKIEIDFYGNKTTVLTNDGKKTVYLFDETAQCKCRYVEGKYPSGIPKLFQVEAENVRESLKNGERRSAFIVSPEAKNLLKNGNFETVDGISPVCDWETGWRDEIFVGGDDELEEGRTLRFANNFDTLTATQKVYPPESVCKNATGFVLSGFARAQETTSSNESNAFRMSAQIFYTDGFAEKAEYANFDTSQTDWQFSAVGFCRTRTNRDKTIDYILVTLEYSNHSGTVDFDDIRLTESKYQEQTMENEDYFIHDGNYYKISDVETIHYSEANFFGVAEGHDISTDGKLTRDDVSNMMYQEIKGSGNNISIFFDGKPVTNKAIWGSDAFGNTGEIYFLMKDGTRVVPFAKLKLTTKQTITIEDGSGARVKYFTDFDGNITESRTIDLNGKIYVTKFDYKDKRLYKITDLAYQLESEKSYDGFGNETMNRQKSIALNADPSEVFVDITTYTDDGNYILKSGGDGRGSGFETTSTYDEAYGRLKSVKLPNGQMIDYSYSDDGVLKSVSSKVENQATNITETHSNNYNFTNGLLTRLAVNNGETVYTFEYDGFGVQTKVSVNGKTYSETSYKDACEYATAKSEDEYNYEQIKYNVAADKTYTEKQILDKNGSVIRVIGTSTGNAAEELKYAEYDENGCVKTVVDKGMGSDSSITMTCSYLENGKPLSVEYTGARTGKISQETDAQERLTQKEVTFAGETKKYYYTYEMVDGSVKPQNRVVNEALPEGNVKYTYDNLGRVKTKQVQCSAVDNGNVGSGVSGTSEVTETYSFISGTSAQSDVCESGRTTTLVSCIKYRGTNYSKTADYGYDKLGNIVRILDGGYLTKYEYDGLNRLLRENNQRLGKTMKYSYDSLGNLTGITSYNYTTGNPSGEISSLSYSYSSGRLTGVTKATGGSRYTYEIGDYDFLGNPCKYRGNVLQWMRGRQLSAYGSNTYKYDANGIRLEKKTASGVTHKYWTEGERIHREYRSNGETLWYYYDASGIEGFSHSGVRYHYLKNLQGDIVGITNSDGNLVAQYFYDAWGNHKVCDVNGYENTSAGFIGNVNPFRYRGYYFDRETGLYYLQSRYYDPEFGRFINADDVSVLTSENAETLGGLNLYAYCNNNPVMLSDPSGYVGKLALVLAIISAVFAAGAAVLSFAALMSAIGNYKREKTATNIFAVVTAAISFGISLIELAVSIVSVVQAIKVIHFAKLAEKSAKVAAQPAVAKNADEVMEAAYARDYDKLAELSTHNPDSNKVMLGRYDDGAPTSYINRAGSEYTYYSMSKYDDVAKIVGTDNMWKINEAFLDQQIALNKTFYASHSLVGVPSSSSYFREIEYLTTKNIMVNFL